MVDQPTTGIALAVQTVRVLVFTGAGLTTLVASLMADEQNQRLKNGAFGTAAGGFVGALMALITKDDGLLILGFVGSAVGAFLGWLASLLLSLAAAKTPVGRTVLEYQIGGWQAVRERLSLEEREPLLNAFVRWGRNFSRFVQTQKSELSRLSGETQRNQAAEIILTGWLLSIVEIVDLLFSLGKRPHYRSRVTIIVFGRNGEGTVVGHHWLADSGRLASHKKSQAFDEKSIGYRVLSGELSSPYFTTGDQAKKEGQNRGEQAYRPFITFRVTSDAVLAVDWPGALEDTDAFVQATRDLFHMDVVPAIAEVLDLWSAPLATEVKLRPLQPIQLGEP